MYKNVCKVAITCKKTVLTDLARVRTVLSQISKTGHAVDFATCLNKYAKWGVFALVGEIQGGQNANT